MKRRWTVVAVVAVGIAGITLGLAARARMYRDDEDAVLVFRQCKRGGGGYMVLVVPGKKWKYHLEPTFGHRPPPF